MPHGQVESKQIAEHSPVDTVLQVALTETWVQAIDLKLAFGDICLVQSVLVDIIRSILIENEKESHHFFREIGTGRSGYVDRMLVELAGSIHDCSSDQTAIDILRSSGVRVICPGQRWRIEWPWPGTRCGNL